MILYTSDEDVADLETRWTDPGHAGAIDHLVELAWHLRQRDTRRAVHLAGQAERSFMDDPQTSFAEPRLLARICLIRAEAAWLEARLEAAAAELEAAIAHFESCQDLVGLGDAALLEYHLASDRGEAERRRACLDRAAIAYEGGGDEERRLISLAWRAVDGSFGGATEPLEQAKQAREARTFAPVEGLLNFAAAQLAFVDGAYGRARTQFEQAAAEMHRCGLIRQSIAAMMNASLAIGNLNDFQTQVEMVEGALALVRPTGWPFLTGACLYCLGDAHHSLGRITAARAAFDEARTCLRTLPNSRVYVVTTTFLAEINFRLGLSEAALEAFEEARAAATRGGHEALLPRVLAGLAACLSRLGQADDALKLAAGALRASAGRDLVTERLATLTLARIHGAHTLPPPDGMTAASASLHYLDKIWAIQASDPDWQPDGEILGEFAAAWERLGDLPQALSYERRRVDVLAREGTHRAEQQVVATQARHEATMARMETDHQRRLVEAERGRLVVLERLSTIGQEITATLDAVDILSAVNRHIGSMLDATALSLWLLDDDVLRPVFAEEDGKPVPGPRIPLTDPRSAAARAARERREILSERAAGPVSFRQIPGKKRLFTALFAPLMVGDRVLGVISIQSAAPCAYDDHKRLIFRNICAYTAIALANAANFQLLTASHEKLVVAQQELERMANSDTLTGLANRRYFATVAKAEIARAIRFNHPLIVLMLDIDHFKLVNDRYGHLAGDVALGTIARLLEQSLRPSDLIARHGGEEFVALLPETDGPAALITAERLRKLVEAAKIETDGHSFQVTVSVGVARWQAPEPSIEAALARADQALYRVKESGRNGVIFDPASTWEDGKNISHIGPSGPNLSQALTDQSQPPPI